MTDQRRVTVGKFDPTVRINDPERYYVGIEDKRLLGPIRSRDWSRVATFSKRRDAAAFAKLLRRCIRA